MAPLPFIHALTLLKQSWSSWQQFLVWGWIQSIAARFLEIAAASGLVVSPLRCSCLISCCRGCVHLTHSHFCSPAWLLLLQRRHRGLVWGWGR